MINVKTAYTEAAVECIPTKPRVKCRVPWELLELDIDLKIPLICHLNFVGSIAGNAPVA